mmetsp:Transcript_5219/g.15271  ORF Transcript_5219/g.15271 Transcript_5219/m.15271 type:complete len:214 (-) Transcript_5219:261-902(-)
MSMTMPTMTLSFSTIMCQLSLPILLLRKLWATLVRATSSFTLTHPRFSSSARLRKRPPFAWTWLRMLVARKVFWVLLTLSYSLCTSWTMSRSVAFPGYSLYGRPRPKRTSCNRGTSMYSSMMSSCCNEADEVDPEDGVIVPDSAACPADGPSPFLWWRAERSRPSSPAASRFRSSRAAPALRCGIDRGRRGGGMEVARACAMLSSSSSRSNHR